MENAQPQNPEELLPGMAESFASVGLDELPAGLSRLTRKQQAFALEYLRTGSATEAARRAGYSSPESDGAKVQKNAEVAGFLGRAAIPVAKNADQLVRRASERSRAIHALWEAELAKPEGLRNKAELLRLQAAADKTDALLGSLIGKIQGVHVTGEVKHKHELGATITVPESALPAMAQLRRNVVQAAMAGATGGTN